MSQSSFCVLILAAGASSRLGCRKQTLSIDGETLLDRAVRTAIDSGASDTLVVLGSSADEIQKSCKLRGCRVFVNSQWKLGISSSIRAGIEALQPTRGAILMTCDMPRLTPDHLKALARTGETTASQYEDGQLGVPAYFSADHFAALLQIAGDDGAKSLLRGAPSVPLGDLSLDIDTPEDLALLLTVSGIRNGRADADDERDV